MAVKQKDVPAEGTDLIAELKKAVHDSGRSQSDIARACGLSQSQLSRFIAGERTLSLESAAKLFAHLGLRVVQPETSETGSAPSGGKSATKPKKK